VPIPLWKEISRILLAKDTAKSLRIDDTAMNINSTSYVSDNSIVERSMFGLGNLMFYTLSMHVYMHMYLNIHL
jgi:hypothetical protein